MCSEIWEKHLAATLRTILARLPTGESIPETDEFQRALSKLEFFVPALLAELHPEWKYEGLDGLIPLVARRTGEAEAEIFGLCIIISDQTTTPIHLRLQISGAADAISWMECRLGEAGAQGMLRTKWTGHGVYKQLYALEGRADQIQWVYKVTFGKRWH